MTPDTAFSPAETTALVFLTGFAIQQVLQMLDPLVNLLLFRADSSSPRSPFAAANTTDDLKKTIMTMLAAVLGGLAAWWTGIRLIVLLLPNADSIGDFFVTALVLGSGTDAVNSVVKYLGYVKDARNPAGTGLEIEPHVAAAAQGSQVSFRALERGSASPVTWQVLDMEGGQINPETGLYSASQMPGTYRILATSKRNPSRTAVTTITVV